MRKVLIIAWTALTRLARDRKALITLLLMPMVLIGILGSALGSMLDGGGIHPYTVIIINADQPAKPAVPEGTPQQVRDALPTMDLGKLLATEVLTSDQVKEIITLQTETDLDKAKEAVAKGQAAAAVHVPADFTANVINSKAANIDVYSDPGMATQAEIVQQIVQSFTEQVTTGNMVSRLLGPDKAQQAVRELTERLPVVKEASAGTRQVKAIQYYAAAMAVMF
ncbi:MAG TPA: ABC transporter permease, partial [Symbiobacteriaceae bacterium]|nr:ABC transporter permease [Symbiobacteriaceae bacterium]